MLHSFLTGIQVAEQPGPDQGIARGPTAVTAFVGRTLRGPVNRPVSIASFNEYQAVFGGLWQPSTLSYAVEQYFDNGGRTAIVVRVTNGGQPPTLTLNAGAGQLVLKALQPGTREFLRASVDYDGIAENEDDRFNLVVQRVRAPQSEHVEDQEIFRRLSIKRDDPRYVVEALVDSQLVRAVSAAPAVRPERTLRHDGRGLIGYVYSNSDGNDGAPLSDYDIIGSASEGTGLFALRSGEPFNLLCIPPLARETDIGPGTLFVAAKFCRDNHALLLVDPPHHWRTAEDAVKGLRDWELHSENALMYFPRLLGHDRLRGRFERFASCGAIAGMMARNDEKFPVWSAAHRDDMALRPGYRPSCDLTAAERIRLFRSGVNALLPVRTTEDGEIAAPSINPCTLAAGNSGSADWKYLRARRLALFIASSIERDTRWVVFETNTPALRKKVTSKIRTFLQELDREGAFMGHLSEESWFVVCDERFNGPDEVRTGAVNILFGFAAQRPGTFHTFLVTHTPAGSRVRPVSVNRLETGGRRLEDEMEGEPLPLRTLAG